MVQGKVSPGALLPGRLPPYPNRNTNPHAIPVGGEYVGGNLLGANFPVTAFSIDS